MENIVLLCDGINGVHIPKIMAGRLFDAGWTGITAEDVSYFNSADPYDYDDRYWLDWADITERAEYTDENGVVFTLHCDGDLFAVAWEELTDEEKESFFGF